jgi:hypothetical protein
MHATYVNLTFFASHQLNILKNGKQALAKLGRIATRIRYNHGLGTLLASTCEKKECRILRALSLPVKTRWNSLTTCIGDAISVRPALQVILSSSKSLMDLALSEEEWAILCDLYDLLKVRSNSPPAHRKL